MRKMPITRFRGRLLLGAGLACTLLWAGTPLLAGDYRNSSHGSATSGVDRSTIDSKYSAFSKGNCAHCHEQHASLEGVEPNPVTGAVPYATFAHEQDLCLACHDGSPALTNVQADITKANKHGGLLSDTAHHYGETLAELSTTKHVECVDCHNPHAAQTTLHTAGSNAIATNSLLLKVFGATPTWSTANWTAPAVYTMQTATKEYEICFKCHSGANTNWASWGGTAATAWTDVALEFSPYNRAGHPIAAGLSSYANSISPKALVSAQLTSPWNVNMGTQTMYCSDCHASDSTVAGPHGSATKWMLAGTNKAWPYTLAANNGTSAGTFRTLSNSTTGSGGTNGLFCLNCHPATTSASSNSVHRKGDHSGYSCVACHIRVPHGSKVSRFITANGGGLPARYYPDGNGGGHSGFSQFRKSTISKDSYAKTACRSSCAGDHSSSVTSPESW